MYTATGTYYCFQVTVCCPGWIEQDNRQSPERIVSTNCCIRMVVPPDDGHRYA
jgi:hypothetical protein